MYHLKIFVFQGDFVYTCATPVCSSTETNIPLPKAVSSSQKKKKKYNVFLAMNLIASVKRTVITIKDANILHSSVGLSHWAPEIREQIRSLGTSWFFIGRGSHLQSFFSSDSLWGHGVLHSTARQEGKACCYLFAPSE